MSTNNFPTAAGLASSAAGFAALVRAIANLYALPQSPTELSLIARQGSGSACRSLLGGFVAWDAGRREDGQDSCARSVAPRDYWPEMRALILVVSAEKKGVSSTAGMQATVATSSLFKTRADVAVPMRMKQMEKAIQDHDFETFANVTMADSNSFHATCLDTVPPIFYLNDVSRAAIRMVESINEKAGRAVAAYTFDAGPNAVVYYLERDENAVAGVFRAILLSKDGWVHDSEKPLERADITDLKVDGPSQILANGVSRVILTGVGEGPVTVNEHLIDEQGAST